MKEVNKYIYKYNKQRYIDEDESTFEIRAKGREWESVRDDEMELREVEKEKTEILSDDTLKKKLVVGMNWYYELLLLIIITYYINIHKL